MDFLFRLEKELERSVKDMLFRYSQQWHLSLVLLSA